jgi:signal transduction histidine kinase
VVVRLGRNRRWVTVAVQDFGIGISRDEQARIFERFHRVSTGAVHDVRGSGLGLSIVQHVAQAHGGRVTVESEPGRGSTITLQLPVGRRAEERAAAGSPAAASGMPPAPEVS